MAKSRKKYSADFKLKAVLEILKGEKVQSQIGPERRYLLFTQGR